MIAVHGGAWTIPTALTQASLAGVRAAADAGHAHLQTSALDAVEAAVRSLEENPAFNAGFGASLNASGEVELDAVIVDGPICNQGLNWWKITGTGNPGWVAEGRRDYEGGYWISAPGTENRNACTSTYPFEVGETVDLLYNVRIHDAPTTSALTKTVVPFENPVLILQGPQCVDGVRWWYVRAEVAGKPDRCQAGYEDGIAGHSGPANPGECL